MRGETTTAVPLLHVLGVVGEECSASLRLLADAVAEGYIALGASFVVASLVLGESAWLLGGMGLWFTGMMALAVPRQH